MHILEVNHLQKQFGRKHVLHDVHFSIKEGEVFGFVGHNGAGKSTFIHTITGIVRKSGGHFSILGVRDDALDDVKKDIGVMPDVNNLYEHMRGIHFLQYMGKLMQDDRPKRDYEQLMEMVGLRDATQKKIKAYSFGMRKKLCLAQALLGNPKFIILDEPTSGLDPESAIHIRKVIEDLQAAGKTIFLTSHNLDEIDKICDRVAILRDGKINKIGSPKHLKEASDKDILLAIKTKDTITEELLTYLQDTYEIVAQLERVKDDEVLIKVQEADSIPLLIKGLVEQNMLIYEVKQMERSLEEVFMDA